MRSTTLPALLGACASIYASIAAAAPTAANASALSCKGYIPFGPNYAEPTGNVEFTVRRYRSSLCRRLPSLSLFLLFRLNATGGGLNNDLYDR